MRVGGLTIRMALAVFAMVLAGWLETARGDDPLGTSLGLTRDSGSLPVWRKPTPSEAGSLNAFARKARQGVMIVGNETSHGSAFVISRKARLLATNAHVADIFQTGGRLTAIRDNTRETYQVEGIWYHPGVLRFVYLDKEGKGQIEQSADPRAGEVHSGCPDVAVLQLAPGPELPFEFEMATRDEYRDIFALPVGMIGYPGYHTEGMPREKSSASATFTEGVISRVTDFVQKPDRPVEELQYLHHSMANWPGFSGSPIFLANGHLIGLHNSAGHVLGGSVTVNQGGQKQVYREVRALPHGVRVDCLWELLAFHDLDGEKSGLTLPVEKAELLLDRYRHPRPEIVNLDAAIKLVSRADRLKDLHRFDEALQKCDEAVARYPLYPRSYLIRAQTQTELIAIKAGKLAAGEALGRLEKAENDIAEYSKLAPSDCEGYLENCHILQFASQFLTGAGRSRLSKKATDIINELLKMRANMKIYDRCNTLLIASDILTEPDRKLAFVNEAIKYYPFDKNVYLNRASVLTAIGRAAESKKDTERFQELLDSEREGDRAWKLATAPLASMRDGAEAIKIARRCCLVTDWKNWRDLDILAASYAEAGDFDKAIECGERSREFAPPEKRPEAHQHLQVYRSRRPLRDDDPDDAH